MCFRAKLHHRRLQSHIIHLTVSTSPGQNHHAFMSVAALSSSLLPCIKLPPPFINTQTHTIAAHCNFHTAAVFACHKSDIPLALLFPLSPSFFLPLHPSVPWPSIRPYILYVPPKLLIFPVLAFPRCLRLNVFEPVCCAQMCVCADDVPMLNFSWTIMHMLQV